ncbi:MAG: hydroxymethylglutaryl-CoA lyase [Geminicoccaceae bacterium]
MSSPSSRSARATACRTRKSPSPTADKVELLRPAYPLAVFRVIEAASFVDPRRVPQMGDGLEVMAAITRAPSCRYAALVPNMRGYERARTAKADEIAIFASASEGFSRANINCSIAESLERFRPVAEAASSDGVPMRGYVSCVASCPYDGPTPPASVAEVTEALLELGCYEVSLGDTTGHAKPEAIRAMLEAVLAVADVSKLAGHYHDTGGGALANVEASLELGLRTFDAAVGGLGGCPYAPGAEGNVATEALVDRLETLGFSTGIDRAQLADTVQFARSLRERP